MSSVASARIARRDPAAIRRTLRFVALMRAACCWMMRDDAQELVRNLNGCDDDLVTLASIEESIGRRCQHFGLKLCGGSAAQAAESIFEAWRSAVA